mgnify:CR=1 FL=1
MSRLPQLSATELIRILKKIGFNVNSIAEVLSLEKGDYLNRRLQTIIVNKKLATTSKSARQLIVHKHILVDGRVVNTPSYIVPVSLENKISLINGRSFFISDFASISFIFGLIAFFNTLYTITNGHKSIFAYVRRLISKPADSTAFFNLFLLCRLVVC